MAFDPDATIVGPIDEAAAPTHLLAGRYEVMELLGRGGSGQVHRAVDSLTQQSVAVKFVRASTPYARRMLRRELIALRVLDLHGVVRLFDDGEDDGQVFLVMELLGESVRTLAAGKPLHTWIGAAERMLETLARVHHAGVIHRDIKPSNILLDPEGQPVITDFGLAQGREVERPTGNQIEGTPRYMAPEQRRGETCDERADIYSLGAVFWEMISGQRFEGAGTEGWSPDLKLADCPKNVRAMLTHMLQPNPKDRAATAVSLLAYLGTTDRVVPQTLALSEQSTVSELRALFFEVPHSFTHVAEDAAELLFRRTDGIRDRVVSVLHSWIRSGRGHWESGQIRLPRSALASLRWEASAARERIGAGIDNPEAFAKEVLAMVERPDGSVAPSAMPALLDAALSLITQGSETERALLVSLTGLAVGFEDPQAIRHALYRVQRGEKHLDLMGLLTGARLFNTGGYKRALEAWTVLHLHEPTLELKRLAFFSRALGRTAPEEWLGFLEGIRTACEALPEGLGRWMGWAGRQAYSTGDYPRAVALLQQAASRLAEASPERLAALSNGAAAALEVPDLSAAEAMASEALGLANQLRHPLAEAWAVWLQRTAAYRSGSVGPAMVHLPDAGLEVSIRIAAPLALNEAAVAWRGHDADTALVLARSAQALYGQLGIHAAASLAAALAYRTSPNPSRGQEVRSALTTIDAPTLALQVAALVAPELETSERSDLWRSCAPAWTLPPDTRCDVLSLWECAEFLGIPARDRHK